MLSLLSGARNERGSCGIYWQMHACMLECKGVVEVAKGGRAAWPYWSASQWPEPGDHGASA